MQAQNKDGGCIIQVWFEVDHGESEHRPRFHMIEPDLPDFEAFCQAMRDDAVIVGNSLRIRKREDGVTEILNRWPTAFRGGEVDRCVIPKWRFVEADDGRDAE